MMARGAGDVPTTLRYVPAAPHAALLLVHGFAEHARRHEATLIALAARGIATFAFDLHGHGNAGGPRDYVGDFTRLVADTAARRRDVVRALPGVPLFIAGFSMGGLVAIRSVGDDPTTVAGLILIAPGVDPAGGVPRVIERLGIFIGRFVPFLPVARVDFQPYEPVEGDLRRRTRTIAARTAAELMRASSAVFASAPQMRVPTLRSTANAIASWPSVGRVVWPSTSAAAT